MQYELIINAILCLFLLVYLTYTLVYPEKF